MKTLFKKLKDIPTDTMKALVFIGVLVCLFTDLNTLMCFFVSVLILIFCRNDK